MVLFVNGYFFQRYNFCSLKIVIPISLKKKRDKLFVTLFIMCRRILSVFMLIIFVTGVHGFSITRHYCSHSGEELFSIWEAPKHDCGKHQTKTQATCCKKDEKPFDNKKATDCCKKTEYLLLKPKESSNCCTNNQHFFQVSNQFIKTSTTFLSLELSQILLYHIIGFNNYWVLSLNQQTVLRPHPPDNIASPTLSFISVFRI